MNFDSKKSVQDFQGQAMHTDQLHSIKGGKGDQDQSSDFIIMDDILDG